MRVAAQLELCRRFRTGHPKAPVCCGERARPVAKAWGLEALALGLEHFLERRYRLIHFVQKQTQSHSYSA